MSDKKKWKDTLNLPKTDFPMKAGLPVNEPKRLEQWKEIDLDGKIREASAGRTKFVLHDGPPYANGRIHIGHALNKILKDLIVRSKRMDGYDVPFVPGWDCHGLPIEHQVDKELGSRKREMSPVEFRRACREFADKFIDIQREDFIRLGCEGDWFNPYSTMNYEYEATIADALGRFFETGMVFKGLKPVHWCTRCQTALAEAEVEYEDKTSPSIFVRFEADESVAQKLDVPTDKPLYAVIWTTTPWTIPSNLAIALHPDLEYAVIDGPDGYHIVASELAKTVAETFGWEEPSTVATFDGPAIERLEYTHPLYDRKGIFVLGEYVTTEAGTGLVHTSPGHGADDFLTGRTYGLDIFTPVDHRGRFTRDVPQWEGSHVYEANPHIVDALEESRALLAVAELHHSYPHCWRCKNPVIFRATEQWFITMDGKQLRSRALEEIEKVEWTPRWGHDRMTGMVENRPDWCISRQRLWGVPITVLYCESCSDTVSSPEFFSKVTEAFREEGADSWYVREAREFLPEGHRCQCGNDTFRKELDILDVWFDSGSSHIAVAKKREELSWPVDVYLEGHDQHRGWFQSSLLIGTGIEGGAPYRQVITHGFVVDEQGRKMSKSVGNVIAPQDILKEHGADILRMWVAMINYRDEVAIGREMLSRISESYRKVRNTARFLLANLADFDPTADAVPLDELEEIDRWILWRASTTFARCAAAYRSYEFHTVYHRLVDLCTVDISAIYSDISKDTLYIEAPDSKKRRSAQTAIYRLINGLVTTAAPIIPFTADEIYEYIPGRRHDSVHLTGFDEWEPVAMPEAKAAQWSRLFELREVVSKVLEEARARKEIGQSLAADIAMTGDVERLTSEIDFDLSKLFIVSHVDLVDEIGDPAATADLEDEPISIGMKSARGNKCGRCWHYREEVSEDGELCERCESIVQALSLA
ncbi:MAG: isoleucine--tRNA ligase [Thermoanaerobaculia bacterium]|nr:isoleucine--tRNA ligase [Thermoanaerobaculia bacterium]